jgi:MFS family permease
MTTAASELRDPSAGFLDRQSIVAGANFNRWLVPPAALAIHLCIGMAYGFSVFWLPMSTLLPGAPVCSGFSASLASASCNWAVPVLTHTFEIFIAMLGISAAIWGGWVERAGPRKSGLAAAVLWGGGLIVGGIGVSIHQLWLVYLGCGFIGGIGLGLGYITPVSALIKWFPDRRGMATGFAIMGFGGGAMIGAPLAVWLMAHFAQNEIAGAAMTLMAIGVLYFAVMSLGAIGFRVPPAGWLPTGWAPSANQSAAMMTPQHVHVKRVWRTPQFWLLWGVLGLNVTAGIGVLAMASPMFQEVFGARLLGHDVHAALSASQKAAIVASAAGLVGLLSLFNSLGRIFWASTSDFLGRKNTYYVFFALGIVLYSALPTLGHLGLATLFVVSLCIILTMYGGGFATIPAYLADLFGTQMVGAIHGRLITSWSVAGIVGPALIAGIRETELANGVAKNLVYDATLYVMAFLLFCGLLCNLFVRPVNPRHFMSADELARERALQHEHVSTAEAQSAARGRFGALGIVAWAAVGIPFAIGLYIALQKAATLW